MPPLLPFTALFLLGFAGAAEATITSLPVSPPFPWSAFVPGTGAGQIRVTGYVTPDGAPGGSLASLDAPLLVVDNTPGHRPFTTPCNLHDRCAPAGTASFQSVLWQGTQQSAAVNRRGAALMGGFTPDASAPAGLQYGFLQVYTDASFPGGTVDGGGPAGKVNATVAGWTPNLGSLFGWNFAGAAVPWDVFDIPFDRAGVDPFESVRFETALVRYDPAGTDVGVLAAFTWSFTTAAAPSPALTGTPITLEGGPSQAMLDLYRQSFPGYAYSYIGGVSGGAAVPEPGAWALLVIGLGAAGSALRRRRAPVACRAV